MRSTGRAFHRIHVKRVVINALHARFCRLTVHTMSIRIAMWSGPRNISTAMLRPWGNRDDTVVIDEPFYAFYLKATGIQHPGAAEVMATGETDARKIGAHLTAPSPQSTPSSLQKEISDSLLPQLDR